MLVDSPNLQAFYDYEDHPSAESFTRYEIEPGIVYVKRGSIQLFFAVRVLPDFQYRGTSTE